VRLALEDALVARVRRGGLPGLFGLLALLVEPRRELAAAGGREREQEDQGQLHHRAPRQDSELLLHGLCSPRWPRPASSASTTTATSTAWSRARCWPGCSRRRTACGRP